MLHDTSCSWPVQVTKRESKTQQQQDFKGKDKSKSNSTKRNNYHGNATKKVGGKRLASGSSTAPLAGGKRVENTALKPGKNNATGETRPDM